MNKKNTQPKNALKAYKPAATAQFTLVPADKRESIDWQSHYYRQKSMEFFNSASYETSPKAVVAVESKSAAIPVLERISKVRANNPRVPLNAMQSKYVMIGGVPHKMVNGQLTALTAQAK